MAERLLASRLTQEDLDGLREGLASASLEGVSFDELTEMLRQLNCANLVVRKTKVIRPETLPIFKAMKKGDRTLLRSLIRNGDTVRVRDQRGRNPLHYAGMHGGGPAPWALSNVMCESNDPVWVDMMGETDTEGNTPLHYACQYGHADMAAFFLENGPGAVDIENAQGHTPYDLHTLWGRRGFLDRQATVALRPANVAEDHLRARTLSAARIPRRKKEKMPWQRNPVSCTTLDNGEPLPPIFNAMMKGDVHYLRELFKEGVEVRFRDQRGRNPLHYAAMHGCGNVPKVFASKLVGEDWVAMMGETDVGGNTPLHYACKNGNSALAEHCLYYGPGANNIRNAKGETPYRMALLSGKIGFLPTGVSSHLIPDDDASVLDSTSPIVLGHERRLRELQKALDRSDTARVLQLLSQDGVALGSSARPPGSGPPGPVTPAGLPGGQRARASSISSRQPREDGTTRVTSFSARQQEGRTTRASSFSSRREEERGASMSSRSHQSRTEAAALTADDAMLASLSAADEAILAAEFAEFDVDY